MPAYRLFFFDGSDHIRHAVVIECDGDDEAVALAHEKFDGRAMELWLRERLVKRFPSDGAGPRSPVRPKG